MADSEETRNEAERQELLEDNKRMWEDVVRLRKWKGSVDEENARLKAERVQLKLEVTRLREETTRLREERAASQNEILRLRDESKTLREDVIRAREEEAPPGPAAAIRHAAQRSEEENANVVRNIVQEAMPMDDGSVATGANQVALGGQKQTVSGRADSARVDTALPKRSSRPLSIPLEVILNIAGFLAGNNDFGTLFNFSIMNRRIRQDCLPTCFETFAPSTTDGTLKMFKWAACGQGDIPPEWQFCKFVYLPYFIQRPVQEYFPNIRVRMTRGYVSKDTINEPIDPACYTSFTAQIALYRPVPAELLSSLLRYPQRWTWEDHEGIEQPRPIQAINSVTIEAHGAILRTGLREVRLVDRNLVQSLRVNWNAQTSVQDALDTFKELGRLAPVKPKGIKAERPSEVDSYPTLNIHIRDGPALAALVESLPSTLLGQSELHIHLALDGDVSRARFTEILLAVGGEYYRIWHRIQGHKPSFTMTHHYSLETDTIDVKRQWNGRLFVHRDHSVVHPFSPEIRERVEDDDGSTQDNRFQEDCGAQPVVEGTLGQMQTEEGSSFL